ncbi:MAG: hypothetical protein HY548_07200, partial [Elusimicrobia bacterium]|nr:hypothetical protein [Elusimicrobiota bacterium]
MKKIRKFRVQARSNVVYRGLKALTGSTLMTPELEKAVEAEIQKTNALFSTAALYNTLGHKEAPEWVAFLWDQANEAGVKPVAVTFYTATIGPGIEEELGDSLTRGEALRSQILTALG